MSHPIATVSSSVKKWSSAHWQRGLLGLAGLAIAAGACVIGSGLVGAIIGTSILLVGVVAPTSIAFGTGVAGLIATTGNAPTVGALGAVGLFAIFIEDATDTPPPSRILVPLLIVSAVLVASSLFLRTIWPLVVVLGVLAGTIGTTLYLVHRYERVMLGLESVPNS